MTTEILPVPRDLEMIDVAQQADRAVQEAEVRLEIIQRVMQVALKATYAQDWIDMGGKPYLAATGAERLASLFGVTITDMDSKRYEDRDERGAYYYFVVTGTAHFRGTSIAVMGTCSARDQFFSSRYESDATTGALKRIYLPAEAVDQPNIVKAAYSNMIANAVTRVLGIRGLTWEQLEQLGFDRKKATAVQFQVRKGGTNPAAPVQQAQAAVPNGESWVDKLEALLASIASDGAGRAAILKSVTAFDTKDGKRFDGYSLISTIRERAKQPEKVAQIAHAKLKEQIEAGRYTVLPPAQPAETQEGADVAPH
jgi:hypothetical protein